MKCKRLIGLVALCLGIILIVLGFYVKGQVSGQLADVHNKTSSLSNNPLTDMGGSKSKKATQQVGSAINEKADEKAAPYRTLVMWLFISGVVIGVAGAGTLACSCRKCSK